VTTSVHPRRLDDGPGRHGTDEWRFDDLRSLYVNCTLKRSPDRSHTQG
jgi:hypothetical protein